MTAKIENFEFLIIQVLEINERKFQTKTFNVKDQKNYINPKNNNELTYINQTKDILIDSFAEIIKLMLKINFLTQQNANNNKYAQNNQNNQNIHYNLNSNEKYLHGIISNSILDTININFKNSIKTLVQDLFSNINFFYNEEYNLNNNNQEDNKNNDDSTSLAISENLVSQDQQNTYLNEEEIINSLKDKEDEITTHLINQINDYRENYNFKSIHISEVYKIFLSKSLLGKLNKNQVIESLKLIFDLANKNKTCFDITKVSKFTQFYSFYHFITIEKLKNG